MENLATLGLDLWSMLLYAVNYGVIFFVLAKYVYPKLRDAINERRQTIEGNIKSAEKLKNELQSQMAKSESEMTRLMKSVQEEKSALQKEMNQKRKDMLQEVEETKTKMLDEARAQITSEKENIIADAQKDITGMIQRVVLNILSHQVPEKTVQESVEQAWKAQRK